MTKRFLYCFALVLALFLIFYQKAEAICTDSPPTCNCGGSQTDTEYRCSSTDCPGAVIQKHTKTCTWNCSWEKTCVCTDSTWDCGNCVSGTETCGSWSSPVDVKTCESWQKCGSTDWSGTQPLCQCTGECLETPENPRYYDNPTISNDSSKNKDPNNIFLPVKLDWDDVQYWQASPDGPQSYKITIKNTTKGDYSKVLTQSEYNYREDPNGGACFLKSDFTQQWQAQACCGVNGNYCGPQSNWNFTTNAAPEPIEPYDPDWNGATSGTPIWNTPSETNPLPVHFKWCSVTEAQSYCIRAYKDGAPYCPPLFCPIIITKTTKEPIDILDSEIDFDLDSFTKETSYSWEVTACFNDEGKKCGPNCPEDRFCYLHLNDPGCGMYGQHWGFFGEVGLPTLDLIAPKNGEFVNLTHSLQWKHVSGAKSYLYELGAFSPTPVRNFVSIRDLWNEGKLDLDTEYSWRVKPCWEEEGKDCQGESWSEQWKFTTTGAPPKILNADATIIPVKLDWEDVPGALSYKHEVIDVSTNKTVAEGVIYSLEGVPPSEILVDYPNLHQERNYSWRVKTCADEEGKACGVWSAVKEFKTFKLDAPTNPYPKDGSEFFTYENHISWNPVLGAKFYQYKIDYGGGEKIPLTIVSTNSIFIPTEQLELGNYSLYVQACLDKDCNAPSGLSSWSFTLVQPTPPAEFGLVPCGRVSDNPNTPWNEREKCGIQHVFIMFKNILDFLLWRVAPIILVLLIILTGIIFYFSMGAPTTIINVKSIWKSAGMGYGVIFLAWIIINFILKFFGYTVRWWIITF